MRVSVELTDDIIHELDSIAASRRVSRASLICEAVTDYLLRRATDIQAAGFGLWNEPASDGLDYQEKLRREWDAGTE